MNKPRRKTRQKPKTAQQRMAARRRRLRAQGLRPVQHWVPDLRDPRVKAQIRKEAASLAKHPENDEIDRWIEAVADLSGWQ
jgi:nicotinamide mononucleotide adenylyltransferase